MALRTVGIRLTAEIADYQSKLRQAGQTTKDFKGELDRAAKKGNLDAVADRAGVVGLSLVGMAGYAIKAAADFDKAMSSVAAATHAPKGEIDQLRGAALQAGKDTMYSATEAADGITELSKAGVSTANILGGGLKGALSLAAAGQLSVGEAAETAASAMTQFKLSGDQVPHVADLLAAAAGKAQGSVHDMGYALQQSGLVAAQFGLSVEDTTGVLAEFASAGLTGSDAGTSLKTMLLALANPSKQTRTAMDELGISFYDASGKFVGLSGVAQVLQTRLKGLTQEQRNAALAQIFGSDAIRSASILYTDGAAGVDKWKNAVNDSGYAAETAQKQTDNLAGDIERLKGSLETLAIEGGSGANKGLRLLAQLLNTIVNQFGNLNPAVSGSLVVLAGLGGALLLGAAAWIKYRKVVADTQEQLIATGPAGEKAAGALGKVTSALGKVGMWAAIAEGISLVFDQIDKKTSDVNKLTDAVQNLFNTGKTAGELNDVFGDNWDKLGRIAGFADSANHGFGHFVDGVANSIPIFGQAGKSLGDFGSRLIAGTDFDSAKQNMADLDQALSTNITSIHDYAKASDLWQQGLAKSGLGAEQLAELLPNTYKELQSLSAQSESGGKSLNKFSGSAAAATGNLGDLDSALQRGADSQDKYATEADAVAGAARGEREALGALYSQLKAETDPVFGLIDAQQKLKKAHDDAAKAVKQHGRNSDEAKAADLQLAQAALGLQNATGNLSSTFNGKLDPAFVSTLRAAGLTKTQIKDVSKQFQDAKGSADKYTGKYAANVSAPGAKDAKKDIDNAYTAANHYAGPYQADITVSGADAAAQKLYGLTKFQQALASGTKISVSATKLFHGLATGGPVVGPGTATSDSIPVLLSNGEYVIKASSAQALGPDRLDHINQTGTLPRYASGGSVGWPFPATASMTQIPSKDDVSNASFPAGGGPAPHGGQTYKWIIGVVKAAFPGLHATSTFRPGAVTLSGNRSYHAVGRAVDFPPSKALAEWVNAHYMSATRELITPWNSLNIHNGQRHTYTGDIYAQHAGLGRFRGNAHDHWAMASGGVISEPIFGIGASGRTYSFGENYQPERVTPMWQTGNGSGGAGINVHLHFSGPIGSQHELQSWLVGSIDDLKRQGRIS